MNAPTTLTDSTSPNPPPGWIDTVTERAADLRFGSILITIHDGRVMQIDVLEKVRMNHGQPAADREEASPS